LWGVVLQAAVASRGLDATGRGGAPRVDRTVPADLKPLIASPQSELRLVTLLYTRSEHALRQLRYGPPSGRGGRGAGGGADVGGAVQVLAPPSSDATGAGAVGARIARLKRFEMSWRRALGRIDAGKLSPAAKADLQALQAAIGNNLAQLDTDAASIAELLPLVPSRPP
jgi:hypothetical protein